VETPVWLLAWRLLNWPFFSVKTCSKCDYYLQNKALNAKAAALSKFWQCTSLHKVSDLQGCQYTQTPYQPQPISKHNSYIFLDHSSGGGRVKRVCLFASGGTPNENNNPTCQSPDQSVRIDTFESLLMGRNEAHCDRDAALRERDAALRERDAALAEKESAVKELIVSRRERNAAVADRLLAERAMDSARATVDNIKATRHYRYDEVLNGLEVAKVEMATLEDALRKSEQSYDEILQKHNNVEKELSTSKEMISVYEQRLVSLSDRVSQLKAKEALHASKRYVFVGTNGPPLFYIKNS